MVKKLRLKFILLSAASLLALLTVLTAGMNLLNYQGIVKEADGILLLLSQNKGAFPEPGGDKGGRLPPNMSPELPFESRYFSVLLDHNGNILHVETSRIAAVDAPAAVAYAKTVMERNSPGGFFQSYRFAQFYEINGTRIIFLDCRRKLDSFQSFLFTSIGMALAGFCVVFLIIVILSGRIVRPIAESYQKQKRFITDAGHEIKTPLTIISANAELLEMELGQNECLTDIRQQVKRLTALTNDLVLLARMEEAQKELQKSDFPISEVVAGAALPFRALAAQQNKKFLCSIQPALFLRGDGKSVEQLVCILIDNALKYSPQGTTVFFKLERRAKNLLLTVENTTTEEVPRESLPHVFDRFYRAGLSRNSQTGGHGIGLSVAKAIVTAHGGKIQALAHGRSFQVTATFPV